MVDKTEKPLGKAEPDSRLDLKAPAPEHDSRLKHTILPLAILIVGLIGGYYFGYLANNTRELMWLKTPALLLEMVLSGIACGVMINIALGRKVSDIGGWVGGALVGLLMFIL